MNDEFYIGYEPQMPEGMAKRIRPAAIGLDRPRPDAPRRLVVAQGRFSSGIFEYGRERTIEGRLIEAPYPAVLVAETPAHAAMTYWLVGPGKHGAADIVRGLDGHAVRVTGSLIARDADSMIEVASRTCGCDRYARAAYRADPFTWAGRNARRDRRQQVSSGCDETRRGSGAPRLCGPLSSRDVTPMFVPSGHDRATGRLALVDPDGRPFTQSLETIAGRPLRVHGTLLARGPQRFLAIERSAIAVAGDESE